MLVRLTLLVILFGAVLCPPSLAQFRVSESQLAFVETELKQASQELAKKLAAIGYEDPGADQGWRVSQVAWEQMDSPLGSPPSDIQEMMRSGKDGITDARAQMISQRFWNRRFVDAYRATNQDKPKTQQLVIEFLKKVSVDYSESGYATNPGWLDNTTDKLCRQCLKAGGCEHPIFQTMSLHLGSWEAKRQTAGIRKKLPKIIARLESEKHSPMLSMLARAAQWEGFGPSNIVNGREVDPEGADELAKAYNQSVLAMLRDESRCPHNIESLTFVLNLATRTTRPNRHNMALYQLLSESDLHEGFKQAALQRVSASLSQSRKLETKVRSEHLANAVKHGQSATELLPLSLEVIMKLISNSYAKLDPEIPNRLLEVAKQRAPGRYSLYRHYFFCLGQMDQRETRIKLLLELLRSEDYSAGIPWIGISFFNGDLSNFEFKPGTIRDGKEVFDAVEALLDKAPKHGKSPKWCKFQRQHLTHVMMQLKNFEGALRVSKSLEGDFGGYKYKGRPVTRARIAKLCNPFARQVDESIEGGTLEIAKIPDTIQKLIETRMDLGTIEGEYIDELLDLLGSIEKFESGEWAELTPKTVYLSNWTTNGKWKATQNGVETSAKVPNTVAILGWRWKVKSEYILEADIEITKNRKDVKWGSSAGFGISNGRFINIPAVDVVINPFELTGEINAHRDKKFKAKNKLNEKGFNRVRMRVWKDYFEFTINGKIAGRYVIPSVFPGHVIIQKRHGAVRCNFKNVRVRKLESPSPTGQRVDDVAYWLKRLRIENESKDIERALATAKSKRAKRAKEDTPEGKATVDTTVDATAKDAQASQAPVKVKDGLVARWTFDQDLTESVSKKGIESELPTRILEGKVGSGLQLSGRNTSNKIVAQREGPIDLDGPFTVCFWARWQNEDGVFFSQVAESAGWNGLIVDMTSRDLDVTLQRSGLSFHASPKKRLPVGSWQHITIAYDGSTSAEGIEIFIGGKQRPGTSANRLVSDTVAFGLQSAQRAPKIRHRRGDR